jgi:hypothetical protein
MEMVGFPFLALIVAMGIRRLIKWQNECVFAHTSVSTQITMILALSLTRVAPNYICLFCGI